MHMNTKLQSGLVKKNTCQTSSTIVFLYTILYFDVYKIKRVQVNNLIFVFVDFFPNAFEPTSRSAVMVNYRTKLIIWIIIQRINSKITFINLFSLSLKMYVVQPPVTVTQYIYCSTVLKFTVLYYFFFSSSYQLLCTFSLLCYPEMGYSL